MDKQEYTLEEISYSRKEDCRIMESVLSNWFQNPKTLNLVSPSLTYPFKFNDWIKKKYSNNQGNIISIVIREKKWIIGHISYRIEKNKYHIFHLFIKEEYRQIGLATRLLEKIEKRCFIKKVNYMTTKVLKKNKEAIGLYRKLGYKQVGSDKLKDVRMEKYYSEK